MNLLKLFEVVLVPVLNVYAGIATGGAKDAANKLVAEIQGVEAIINPPEGP